MFNNTDSTIFLGGSDFGIGYYDINHSDSLNPFLVPPDQFIRIYTVLYEINPAKKYSILKTTFKDAGNHEVFVEYSFDLDSRPNKKLYSNLFQINN